MAESTGLEPVHPLTDDGLAIRCITTLPTLQRQKLQLPYQSFSQKSIVFLVRLKKSLFLLYPLKKNEKNNQIFLSA